MIALAGPDLPQEILVAGDCHAGALSLQPDRETPQAAQWLESKFAPWSFVALEAWAAGEYDHLDAVLFSRSDDTSHRLYYYVVELQRRGLLGGPDALIMDVAKIPRATSLEHTIAKTRQLASRLDVGDAALEVAIARCNQTRAARSRTAGGRVCLLVGTPPPDLRLHHAIAEAGFVPSGQTLAQHWEDLGEPVTENSGDPVAAIARRIHAARIGTRSFADPASLLEARIARVRPQAIILWWIEEDEARTWHLPAERRVLERSGIPWLLMTRRDWLARDGALDEIRAFLDGAAV